MQPWKIWTVFLVTVFCCVQCGSSIKCYVCNSNSDPKCNDPYDSENHEAADCDQLLPHINGTKFCRKTTQKTSLGLQYNERTIRSCGHIEERRFPDGESQEGKYRCYIRTGTFEIEVKYCACEEDNCNGVGKMNAYYSLVSILSVGAVLKFYMF